MKVIQLFLPLQIAQVQFVTAFPAQESLLSRLDTVLNKLSKALNGQRINPKVSSHNAPAEIPRSLIIAQNTFVQVALNRIEMRLSPPEHVSGSVDASVKYFGDVLKGLFGEMLTVAPRADWVGAVLTVQYPTRHAKTAIQAVHPAFKKLLTIPDPGDNLSAFHFMYGVRHGDHFKHITVQGYHTSEFQADIKPGEVVNIPLEQATIKEVGLQLLLDVNNKPSPTKQGTSEEFMKVLSALQDYARTAPNELGLDIILNQ
ncbi:MAG: hypothetical protein KIT44_01880 [Opitutaceae bacterium]|nr:hypothetical protein [Opitutaceae bacterium]